jgi:hypothetical protein
MNRTQTRKLLKNGRFDEKHVAISFLKSRRKEFSKDTFNRVGDWFWKINSTIFNGENGQGIQ